MEEITVSKVIKAEAVKMWGWDKSVKKVHNLFENRSKKVSKELIEELITAKENIGSKVGNPHGRYTWKQYCLDCFSGSPTQRTVENWIKAHLYGQVSKQNQVPKPIDVDSMFIKSSKKNKDGTYTIRISVSEYDDLFEETFVA